MEQNTLRQCQLVQLEIAKEVKRLCEENDICYFLVAGSALGAVRHEGFIPWDDDLDIGMLRYDYDAFINVASSQLSSKYFLQTWNSDKHFGLPIAKIRKNNTTYVERNSKNVGIHSGIYVDIFPLDNVPDSKMLYLIQKYESKILLHLLLNKNGYDYLEGSSKIKQFVGSIIKSISLLFSLEFLQNKMIKCITRFNKSITNRVVAFGGANTYEKETLKREWVSETEKTQFENEKFLIPKQWDEYLTHFYGDYLTPPPKEKRMEGHSIEIVSFENGNIG